MAFELPPDVLDEMKMSALDLMICIDVDERFGLDDMHRNAMT